MAKKPSNLPVSGYFLPQGLANAEGVCYWDPPWVPQNKGFFPNQREIPEQQKSGGRWLQNFPKNKIHQQSATPFLCVCFGLHIYSGKTDRRTVEFSDSIFWGNVGNVHASAPLRFWMFQTLTFFNFSCFLSRLASHQIQAKYIKFGPQSSDHDTQKKQMKTKQYNTFFWGVASFIRNTVKSK